jgi:hypothetical protein
VTVESEVGRRRRVRALGVWPKAESPTWISLRDLVAFLPGIPEGGATPPGCANERRRLWRARRLSRSRRGGAGKVALLGAPREGGAPRYREDDPMGLEGNGAGMGAKAC